MSVTREDVRYIAMLARLGLDDERAATLALELNTILEHMEVLAATDTSGVEATHAAGEQGMPLRPDQGPPIPLLRPVDEFAPEMRDGFFLVPRLASHEDREAES